MAVTKPRPRTATAAWKIAVPSTLFGGLLVFALRPPPPPPAAPSAAELESQRPGAAAGPFAATTGPNIEAELPKLHLRFPPDSARRLQDARDRALAQGTIEQRPSDLVPARVAIELAGEDPSEAKAKVRLKGDMLDHVDSDKWSMRIELADSKRLGMRRFSIQHPKTRSYVAEWLVMNMARQIGLLAPRSRFVEVVINDRPNGVYYLEEHIGKEMLESQGRRDGPIVRFEENTMWSTWLQHDFLKGGQVPEFSNAAASVFTAEVASYERSRMSRTPGLSARMTRAIEQTRAMQDLMIAGMPHHPASAHAPITAKLDALDRLAGTTLDNLLVTDRMGDMLALATLWGATHGLGWHQWRFYHDPVRDRLEPVLFDMGADYQLLAARQDILLTQPTFNDLTRSRPVFLRGLRTLWKLAQPEAMDAFFASIEPQYAAVREAFVQDASTVPASMDALSILKAFESALRAHADFICRVLEPRDPVNFACRLTGGGVGATDDAVSFEIDAWNTTESPVLIDGFRFGNGQFVPAAAVQSRSAVQDETDSPIGESPSVLLPRWSRRQSFVLDADLRLVGLRRIQELKRAIRAAREAGQGETDIRISVEYRNAASGKKGSEALTVLRIDPTPDGQRPSPPTLAEALARHPCLNYEPERDRLSLRRGEWTVDGDLILPAGRALFAEPGATLRFGPGRLLLADGPLEWTGTEADPIVLESLDPAQSWAGLLVIDVDQPNRWRHVVVRRAAGFMRGGWQSSGGVTFYHSSINMTDCRIEDARGEDALNAFGARCTLTRCSFDGGPSDLFDGDFVKGTASHCSFARSGEDAVDVSGSNFRVENCSFDAIGDKAISAGERSTVTVLSATIGRCSIAVAAKDASTVEASDLRVQSAEQFALCAFVKKPEFGPSSIDARRVEVDSFGKGLHLVQTGCSLKLDGVAVPTQDIDVQQLYEQKILGK